MKIGFFDSGIGGLNVLARARQIIPEAEYIYYADTDHVPYGTKERNQIIEYTDAAVDFLIRQGCQAIVIACNTATSAAIQYIRDKYDLPILGMEPAVKAALSALSHRRIIVTGTPLTLKEEKLKRLLEEIDEGHAVDLLPLPKLVTFAEAGIYESAEVEEYLRKELEIFPLEEYSDLVLGCTHFNYFKDTMRKILPEQVEFIDGNAGTVNHLKRILESGQIIEPGKSGLHIVRSGRPVTGSGEAEFYLSALDRADRMRDL